MKTALTFTLFVALVASVAVPAGPQSVALACRKDCQKQHERPDRRDPLVSSIPTVTNDKFNVPSNEVESDYINAVTGGVKQDSQTVHDIEKSQGPDHPRPLPNFFPFGRPWMLVGPPPSKLPRAESGHVNCGKDCQKHHKYSDLRGRLVGDLQHDTSRSIDEDIIRNRAEPSTEITDSINDLGGVGIAARGDPSIDTVCENSLHDCEKAHPKTEAGKAKEMCVRQLCWQNKNCWRNQVFRNLPAEWCPAMPEPRDPLPKGFTGPVSCFTAFGRCNLCVPDTEGKGYSIEGAIVCPKKAGFNW